MIYDKNNIKNFRFFVDSEKIDNRFAFTAVIPKNIKSKIELMSILKEKLSLPDYFGENWDALNDVLNDFMWIDEFSIFMIHEDLPSLPEKELQVYLNILSRSVDEWKNLKKSEIAEFIGRKVSLHELVIFFPEIVQDKIEDILSEKK